MVPIWPSRLASAVVYATLYCLRKYQGEKKIPRGRENDKDIMQTEMQFIISVGFDPYRCRLGQVHNGPQFELVALCVSYSKP